MKYAKKLKEMIKGVYQIKPTLALCVGRAVDMLSTYLGVKKYSIYIEINPLMREIFKQFGAEGGTIVGYLSSIASIPIISYLLSKGSEKLARKLIKIEGEKLSIWKEIYYPLSYGISLGFFYASLNNSAITFAPEIISHYNFLFGENGIKIGSLLVISPFSFYGYKIYKKLKPLTLPSISST